MDAPYRIRSAVPADAAPLVAIERRCFSDPWSETSFREALESPWTFGFVAQTGRGIAGYLIGREVAGTGEVLNLAVVARFSPALGWPGRSCGPGSTMLRKRRVEEVYLEVRESNHSAQALYLSSGFRPVGQRAAYYRNPKEDALVLWLRARAACVDWNGQSRVTLVEAGLAQPILCAGPPASDARRTLEVHVSRSMNKAILVGNLGADPEVRSTTNGSRVATLSIATSRQWKNQAGEKQEKTEWHRVVFWNTKFSTLADIAERYCKKGDKVYVEGSIEYRSWQDREGQTRYTTEINGRELILLSGKGDGAEAFSAPSKVAAGAAAPKGKEAFDDFPEALDAEDDDLPF